VTLAGESIEDRSAVNLVASYVDHVRRPGFGLERCALQRFTPLLIDAACPCRHASGYRWCVDETYAKVAGRWMYLYRAIDQYGQAIDVLVSQKRDLAATRQFFTRALEHGPYPSEVSTDRHRPTAE
jgi:transposase-like protein